VAITIESVNTGQRKNTRLADNPDQEKGKLKKYQSVDITYRYP